VTAKRARRGPRIGVLGGSFDPVHVGHLILAQSAVSHLGLDELILVPARRPAHKRSRSLAPVEDRVAMLRLAARGNAAFRVSRVEVDGPDVSYTVRTLEALARARQAEWFFLMGEDSLAEFDTWREPGRILELARLAVVPRSEEYPKPPRLAVRRRVIRVPMPRVEISSSEIRQRIRRGASVRYWVPDAVLSYMERHGLYRAGRARRA
jgi:nicotinate-nucleotide adenylyltransferase